MIEGLPLPPMAGKIQTETQTDSDSQASMQFIGVRRMPALAASSCSLGNRPYVICRPDAEAKLDATRLRSRNWIRFYHTVGMQGSNADVRIERTIHSVPRQHP